MKRAVILAGGKGTRLHPYTVALPKPLMPIGQYPILEVIVMQLAKYNFEHITMAVNHQADIIKAYFQDGAKWNVTIDYSLEIKPLSTMGPLKLINNLPENFLVMNGDVLSDADYGEFLKEHEEDKRIFSILAHNRWNKVDYGVLKVNAESELIAFEEKPVNNYLVSMGIYSVNKEALGYIPNDMPFGFDHLMNAFLKKDVRVDIKPYDGYWMDIGRPDDYTQAIDDFEQKKDIFNL